MYQGHFLFFFTGNSCFRNHIKSLLNNRFCGFSLFTALIYIVVCLNDMGSNSEQNLFFLLLLQESCIRER